MDIFGPAVKQGKVRLPKRRWQLYVGAILLLAMVIGAGFFLRAPPSVTTGFPGSSPILEQSGGLPPESRSTLGRAYCVVAAVWV